MVSFLVKPHSGQVILASVSIIIGHYFKLKKRPIKLHFGHFFGQKLLGEDSTIN